MLAPIVPILSAIMAAPALLSVDGTGKVVALVDVANVVGVESIDMADLVPISIPAIPVLPILLKDWNQRQMLAREGELCFVGCNEICDGSKSLRPGRCEQRQKTVARRSVTHRINGLDRS
jgi:hypothetical protein